MMIDIIRYEVKNNDGPDEISFATYCYYNHWLVARV